MNSRKEILSQIKETISSSSIHAFPNIVQNKYKTIKFVWIVCFLISSAACAYLITTTISEYLNFEVVSKSTVKYLSSIDFPIITICHTTTFNTEYANEFLNHNYSDFDFSKTPSQVKYDFLANRYKSFVSVKSLNESMKQKMGQNLDYLLITCLFNIIECNLVEDFEYYYDIMYGKCYRYNSGKNMNGESTSKKQITTNGLLNGLQIELFVGRADQNDKAFSIDNGINLFIESKVVESQSAEGIRISPGSNYYISLSKYSMSHLPKPYSDCTAGLDRPELSDNIFFRNLIANNQTYTESLCRFNCFQKYLGDKCNCKDLFTVPFYKDMPFCFTDNKNFICLASAFTNFSKFGLFEKCDCPVRSENNFYTFKLSNSQYPTKFYAQFLSKNQYLTKKYNFSQHFKYEDYENKLAAINIFYDDLKETIIEHNPKLTEVELISNIGGTLGLFCFLYSFLNISF
jgi:hypothetical protein